MYPNVKFFRFRPHRYKALEAFQLQQFLKNRGCDNVLVLDVEEFTGYVTLAADVTDEAQYQRLRRHLRALGVRLEE